MGVFTLTPVLSRFHTQCLGQVYSWHCVPLSFQLQLMLRDWGNLTEISYLRKDQRTPWAKKVIDPNLLPEHLQFSDNLQATDIQNTNCRGRNYLTKNGKDPYKSFCSVQLPSKQFFWLPYGHYVIARYTGKNGHEQKKGMTNCCMKMLRAKPDLK